MPIVTQYYDKLERVCWMTVAIFTLPS